jgi:hypothetical protein
MFKKRNYKNDFLKMLDKEISNGNIPNLSKKQKQFFVNFCLYKEGVKMDSKQFNDIFDEYSIIKEAEKRLGEIWENPPRIDFLVQIRFKKSWGVVPVISLNFLWK